MAFTPRTFAEILDDMIAYVQLQTDITDFEPGSVVRTLLEASASEDDEQYFQMVQLLDAFKLSTATGSKLDGRLQDYDLTRLGVASATCTVVIQDLNLVTSFVALDISAGATSVVLDDTSSFPTSGFPFTLRLGEGTTTVEEVSVSANDTGTNTLTMGATTFAHNAGERASVVSGASNVTLSPGLRVQVPAGGGDDPIVFVTSESGTLVNGNFSSTPISAAAEIPGEDGNIGVGKITEFSTSAPFAGAAVTNTTNAAGGREVESDADFRSRGKAAIQSLTAGTRLALKEGVIGVTDPVTGQSVVTSSVVESFVSDEVVIYVDDGTGFNPDEFALPRDSLSAADAGGSGTLTLTDSTDFPETGFALVSPESAAQIEVVEFSGVDHGTHVMTLVGTTANAHDIGDEIALLDVIEDSAEAGANFFQLANFPVVRSSFRLWQDDGSGPSLLVDGTDYFLNRGTGELELTGAGVPAGAALYGSYTHYTGLLKEVQRVIDGDLNDPTTYPGIVAEGIFAVVETPVIRRITVSAVITAIPGVQETDLVEPVIEAIETYINALGIGEDVILAEMIERAMNVPGMFNIKFTTPTTDLVVLETELPVPFDAAGNSIVSVS